MPVRRAACDPCRLSKLACDHARPTCRRCRDRGQPSSCIYRQRPFKKRKITRPIGDTTSSLDQATSSRYTSNPGSLDLSSQRYPNLGFLGPSSRATIFDHFTLSGNGDGAVPSQLHTDIGFEQRRPFGSEQTARGQHLIVNISQNLSIKSCADLVRSWLSKGNNLALAAPYVSSCIDSVEQVFTRYHEDTCKAHELSETLFLHSCSTPDVNNASTLNGFVEELCHTRIRWEVLGIYFTAVSRATEDISQFPGLYSSPQQRLALRQSSMQFADTCLDFCLSLDTLNDTQLVLQYENFINHSCTNGDESYQSWKRLGDVISSIYALGYHTQTRTRHHCPQFLVNIREAAFAFTYSADKNVSIFLGRPPRMLRKHCNFTFLEDPQTEEQRNNPLVSDYFGWSTDEPFDYMAEAWWSMTCAMLKEKVLDLVPKRHQDERANKACQIQAQAERSWAVFPPKYRLEGDLLSASHAPIERDFIASARLNYLHVRFLLQLSLSEHITRPAPTLLAIAAEIFNLVVETSMVKEHLVNSGTGIQWKVAHYGLPAAGVLCFSLLNGTVYMQEYGLPWLQIIQDLGVLVTQVKTKSLIDVTDANYVMFSEATKSITMILKQTLQKQPEQTSLREPQRNDLVGLHALDETDEWMSWFNTDHWSFEVDFWTNLAEHPSLE